MAANQIDRNKKYIAGNEADGFIAVRVWIPEDRRLEVLNLAQAWRDKSRKLRKQIQQK
jgi:hypothetical protein